MIGLGPTRQRMNRHAIAVLEDAAEQARDNPIAPSPSVRLALSWLTLNRVAQSWHAKVFWDAMVMQRGASDWMDGYCRRRDMASCLDRWKTDAKV